MAKIIDFFDGAQSSTVPVIGDISGAASTIEVRTITALEESSKQLTLEFTPLVPGEVLLAVAGAPTQVYGIDYTVSGTVLTWSALGLDGLLVETDKITLIYNI